MNRLHELIQTAFGTFTLVVAIVLTVLGFLCLFSGKKFYFLAVGICAFLVSYVSIRGMINWTDWQEFTLAGIIGLIAMVFAVLFPKFVIAISAFFVFGLMLSGFINEQVHFEDDSFIPLIVFFIAGSFAAFFSFYKYEVCIRLMSSVVGALGLTIGIFKFAKIVPSSIVIFLVWIGISVIGFMWQQSRVISPYEENQVLEDD